MTTKRGDDIGDRETASAYSMTRQAITQHEGFKYLRVIHSADAAQDLSVRIDVYAVLEAFAVTCPARAHAIKKLLCAGLRGKGDELADLNGAMAALNRAIDLEEGRVNTNGNPTAK